MKQCRRVSILLLLLVLVVGQVSQVFADSLPQSELTAIDNYPDWIGLCGSDISGLDSNGSTAGATAGSTPDVNVTANGNVIHPASPIIQDLLNAQAATNVPASVLLAQGAYESGNAGWWDKSKVDDNKAKKFSYFKGGGKHNLNEAFGSYDTNPAGHGPMQLDNWPGSYGGSTGNYTPGRFTKFKQYAQAQFGADNSLDPTKIGNIAMMFDTSILYAAIIDAELLPSGVTPDKATPDQWAQVLDDYGTLRGASSSTKDAWKSLSKTIDQQLGGAAPSDTSTPASCCPSGSSDSPPVAAPANPADAPVQPTVTVPTSFTLKDKIGRLLFVGVSDDSEAADLEKNYQIGGFLLNSGASYSKSDIDKITAVGTLPPFIAADEEGGQVQRLSGVITSYPSAKQLGKMSDDQVKKTAADIGKKMANLDINIDFAPVVDLDNGHNAAISQVDRSFSSDPDTVANKAGAFADGLKQSGVIPTFKHFPGLGNATGSTNGNTDTGSATTPSLSSLENNDLKPYEKLLGSSQQSMVMMGNQIVPGLTGGDPASMSKAAYDLLRGKYGFSGVVVTDEIGNAVAINPRSPSQAVITALKSGADMPLFNASSESEVGSIIDDVAQAVQDGTISTSQIDASVNKVLQLNNKASTQPASQACVCPGSDASLTGSGHVSQAFNFFVGKGLTAFQAAVIVGTIMEEGGHSLNPTDVNPSSGAYGIAQWLGGRLTGLESFAGSQTPPTDKSDFATQLGYMWDELSHGYKSTLDKLKGQTDIDTAVYDFEATYEVSGHQLIPERQADAKQVLHDSGGGPDGGPATPTDCSGSSPGSSGISAYKNPLRGVQHLTQSRIDQGVDYTGSGSVYAMGDGTVVNVTNDGWYGVGKVDAFIVYKLSAGPAAGKFVYFAENCTPKVSIGDKVYVGDGTHSPTVICDMIPDNSPRHPESIETGWADGTRIGDALAHDVWIGHDSKDYYTDAGKNYSDLLVKLGAPPGTIKSGATELKVPLPSDWPKWN